MASVYDADAFAARVNYAARCLRAGGDRIHSRAFDTCFESNDGDLVITALMRRATKKPELVQAIKRALGKEGFAQWRQKATEWAFVPSRRLASTARAMREQASASLKPVDRP